MSRAGIPAFGSPKSSKRASFTPMTGNFTPVARPNYGHRRISSVSDTTVDGEHLSISPNTQTLAFPENTTHLPPPSSSRRYSGLFGRTSPSQLDTTPADQLSTEMEALRKELNTIKDELDNTKHELMESNEAREASETCVKALREFIGENSIGASETSGLTSLKLPPPPTMAKGEDEDESKKTGGGAAAWGFKLWKDAAAPRAPVNVPQSATVASPAAAHSPQLPMSATPLSRKIGGFFSSRSSISSVTSSVHSVPTAMPSLQSNAASVRDSMYSVSDTSSMAEPISPPNEYNTNIVVRDVTNISDLGSTGSSPEIGKEILHMPSHHGLVTS